MVINKLKTKRKFSELVTMNISSVDIFIFLLKYEDSCLCYDINKDLYFLEGYDKEGVLVTKTISEIMKQSVNNCNHALEWLFEHGFFKRVLNNNKYDFYELDVSHLKRKLSTPSYATVEKLKKRLGKFPVTASEMSCRYFLRSLCVDFNVYLYHIVFLLEEINTKNLNLKKLLGNKLHKVQELKQLLELS